jgi:hypothetical protein
MEFLLIDKGKFGAEHIWGKDKRFTFEHINFKMPIRHQHRDVKQTASY